MNLKGQVHQVFLIEDLEYSYVTTCRLKLLKCSYILMSMYKFSILIWISVAFSHVLIRDLTKSGLPFPSPLPGL